MGAIDANERALQLSTPQSSLHLSQPNRLHRGLSRARRAQASARVPKHTLPPPIARGAQLTLNLPMPRPAPSPLSGTASLSSQSQRATYPPPLPAKREDLPTAAVAAQDCSPASTAAAAPLQSTKTASVASTKPTAPTFGSLSQTNTAAVRTHSC